MAILVRAAALDIALSRESLHHQLAVVPPNTFQTQEMIKAAVLTHHVENTQEYTEKTPTKMACPL